jgi:hypothetical protein
MAWCEKNKKYNRGQQVKAKTDRKERKLNQYYPI